MRTGAVKGILAKISLLSLLAVGAMSASCVKEDMGDCPPALPLEYEVHIDITPDVAASAHPEFYDIDSVTVFIFDEAGLFYALAGGGPYTLGADYSISVPLPPGQYSFVVLTNQGSRVYDTNFTREELEAGRPALGDVATVFDIPDDGIIDEEIPDLHMGANYGVTIGANASVEIPIALMPLVHRVNFTIYGLHDDGGDYRIEVADQSAGIDMDVSTRAGEDICYRDDCAFTGEARMEASIVMLDISEEDNLPVTFSDLSQSEPLYTDELIAMIEKAYHTSGQTIDFDTTFEYDVEIIFRDNGQIVISVNGWIYIEQQEEL